MNEESEISLIRKFDFVREICIKCKNPAVSICPSCGVLCQNHNVIHRQETGHSTQMLNWREQDQPISQEKREN